MIKCAKCLEASLGFTLYTTVMMSQEKGQDQ